MIRKPRTITGLDIGSSKVCAVQAALDEQKRLRVLGFNAAQSRGVERGSIVEIDGAIDAVSRTLGGLKEKTGKRPENIYASVSSQTLRAQSSDGMVRLSTRGREITKADMAKCVDAAGTIKLPYHKDIIHRIVQSFYVDDDIEVKNPFGLYGSRLTANIVAVTVNAAHLLNLQKVLNNAGYQPKEFVFSGLADFAAIMKHDDEQRCVALLDIGASLTELSVFVKGILRFVEIIPLGGQDIRTSLDVDKNFGKIQSTVKKRIEQFHRREEDINEVIITGGFSLIDGLVERLEEAAGIPARLGAVKEIVGNIANSEMLMATTCLGIAKYALKEPDSRTAARGQGHLIRRFSSGIVDLFTRYF